MWQQLRRRQLQTHQSVSFGGARLFAFDKSTRTATGRAQVKAMAPSLRYVHTVTCEGYADYGGRTAHETRLAKKRAATVCALVEKYAGQVTSRSVKTYGGSRPVVIGGPAPIGPSTVGSWC